jgi:hypothetical protein
MPRSRPSSSYYRNGNGDNFSDDELENDEYFTGRVNLI